MDIYLSRRIKNWAAEQHPTEENRQVLLLWADSSINPSGTKIEWIKLLPRLARRSWPERLGEKYLLQNRTPRQMQLSFLQLEIIWRASPLRYA